MVGKFYTFGIIICSFLKLKLEVHYAKATSVLLSKTDLIFCIMNVKNGKRTTKSAEEFAENLKILFGKTQNQDPDEVDTMELFRRAISLLKNSF